MKRKSATVLILAAAALWGCIALFYNALSSLGFTPLQVVFIRVSLSALLMLLYVGIRNPALMRIRLRDLWMFLGTGVASLAFFNYCYFSAMDELSPSVAAVLLYTAPTFVLIMSAVIYRERITLRKILVLVMTLIGCIFVTEMFKGNVASPFGILLGLGAGFGYALYSIFTTVALRRYASETITLYTFITASLSVLPLCDPAGLIGVAQTAPLDTLLFGLGIALLACVLPYLLYTKGLQGVKASQASVMATLEPVVATVIGVSFLGDELSVSKVIGMITIVSGIILLNKKSL